MKYGVLAILAAMMLFATTIQAEESEDLRLNTGDIAAYLLEKTISQPKFTRPPFKSFETDAWYLKFLESFSKAEYGFERETHFPVQGLLPQKQALVARFQLFNRPIYLTFSIGE